MDHEWYLRRCGEDELGSQFPPTLAARAVALAAAGVIDTDTARGIVWTYQRARALRGHPEHDFGHRPGQAASDPPAAPRVVACNREVATPTGAVTVDYVVLADDQTRFAVHMRDPVSGSAGPGHWSPPILHVVDEQGGAHTAHFSGGGGGDGDWEGTFTLQPGLPRETRAVTVSGELLELVDPPVAATVRVEPIEVPTEAAERAAAHLRALAATDMSGEHSIATACDAYVECGVLAADSPVIDEVVAAAGRGHARAMWHHRGHPGRRGVRRRPRARAVGVVSPAVDGQWVAVLALRAAADHVALAVESSHPLGEMPHGEVSFDPPITVSIEGPNGHRCIGRPEGWGGHEDRIESNVVFPEPLAADAPWAELVFGLRTARVVVRVPLDGAES